MSKKRKRDNCDVCGDAGIFGMCSACGRLYYGAWPLAGLATIDRQDLNWWLGAKGINPETHVTGGDLRPAVPEVARHGAGIGSPNDSGELAEEFWRTFDAEVDVAIRRAMIRSALGG